MKSDVLNLLSAAEAADYLGIKRSSLYTYVSRGLLEPVAEPGRKRKLYRRSDLQGLRTRQQARSARAASGSPASTWGDPVLSTELSLLDGPSGISYRGLPLDRLLDCSFEQVVEHLWTGSLPAQEPSWVARGLGVLPVDLGAAVPRGASPLESLAFGVPALASRDPSRLGSPATTELHRARRLMLRLSALLALGQDVGRCAPALRAGSLAATVGQALGAAQTETARKAIDRALIASAEHGLDASTFAVRVVASAGADLYSCVAAGLAALAGPLQGGACERIEALVDESATLSRPADVVVARRSRGEAIPGFGHPQHPSGDPRAPGLLEAARSLGSGSARLAQLLDVVQAMEKQGHPPPNLDLALVALSAALGLPSGSALGLFAIGRCAGWIGHALEQRRAGFVLSPRARYVGPEVSAS